MNLSNATILKNRTLYYDGDSVIEPDMLVDLVLDGKSLGNVYVSEITPDVEHYNSLTTPKIELKTVEKPLDFSWDIPEEYLKLDVRKYVYEKFNEFTYRTSDEYHARLNRIQYEFTYLLQPEYIDYIRTLIYVNEEMEKNDIVKGVGRGSSVASYVLYLIGTHHIDSYKYDLEFHEFIRIED